MTQGRDTPRDVSSTQKTKSIYGLRAVGTIIRITHMALGQEPSLLGTETCMAQTALGQEPSLSGTKFINPRFPRSSFCKSSYNTYLTNKYEINIVL